MAKSMKIEDYYREHNIETLFRELTQILVRRMPPDPAVAIVEHLQKKFPKSFKTSADNVGIAPKTLANSLQLPSSGSPYFDAHNESINDLQMERRSSNQSFFSGPTALPTTGSAFTDLLKHDTSTTSQTPDFNLRTLVSANRVSQQTVKMGKDIRSDHEILEEEAIKPTKNKPTTSTAADPSIDSVSENMENSETHEEPTVKQIIKYKQHIRTENDRRSHREELAKLAQQQREKDAFFQTDLSTKPEEIKPEHQAEGEDSSTQVVPTETNANRSSRIPVVNSKEEQDILNDENVFQPRQLRQRGRQRNRVPTSTSNTTHPHGRHLADTRSTTGQMICKLCGHVVTAEDKQISAAPTARPLDPQQSTRSVDTSSAAIDDWFEAESNAASSRQTSPWTPDDSIPFLTGSTLFRQNLFQPINDNNNDTIEDRPRAQPLSTTATNETTSKRLNSPHMSESGVFARSPEAKIRRPSSTRSIPSPLTKKHQPDTATITNQQVSKTIAHPSPPTTVPISRERRMSGWSVREHSPDASDEN